MKSKVKFIIVIIAFVVVVDLVIDLLLWVNAFVDGKYYIEEQSSDFVVDTYYMRISSLSAAMFANLFLAIVLLFLFFIKRNR